MNIVKELVTLIMLVFIISISMIFALVSSIVCSFVGFFLSAAARFRKEEINEHGYVEKTIN